MTLRERARAWLWVWLLSIDQGWNVKGRFVSFVLLGRGKCPSEDETISSWVGRNALEGKRWALAFERIIDALAWRIARQRNHCRASIERHVMRPAPISGQ
jgi:hypothetical protein